MATGRSAVWTMHCRDKDCPEVVTGASSEAELVKMAVESGWHVHYSFQLFGYDSCPKHIEIMDRIDWGSTA